MKTTLLTALVILLGSNVLHAQEKAVPKYIIKSGIVIKSTPIPLLFETTVGGKLEINQQSLSFIPYPCSEKDKKGSAFFPCNNHLINRIDLSFSDISKIKRRNYLLLFPNRIIVRKSDGETYLFVTFKRKRIIDTFNKYKLENSSTNKYDSHQ